jgi:cobalt-zinc-cadmium efflux system outer membrane protein
VSSARLLSFILPALVFSSLSAHAADGWSLSNLVGHALTHHPALRSAGHAVRAEQARSLSTARWSDPRLVFQVEDLPADDPAWGSAQRTATLVQEVPGPGKRGHLRRAAAASVAQAEVEEQALRAALARDVWVAWADALAALRRTVAAGENRQAAQDLLRIAERGQQAGAWGEAEVLAARAEAEGAALDVQEAGRRQQQALRKLGLLVGAEVEAAQLDPAQLGTLPVAAAGGESPILRQARADLAQRAAAERVAQSAAVPDVELSAGLGWAAETGDRLLEFGVGLPLPLFNRRRGEIEGAREDRLAAEAALEAAHAEAAAGAESLRADLAAAQARVEAYGARLLPLARQSYAAAERSFEAGRTGWATVLEARRALARVEAEQIEQLQAWHAAAAGAAYHGIGSLEN